MEQASHILRHAYLHVMKTVGYV